MSLKAAISVFAVSMVLATPLHAEPAGDAQVKNVNEFLCKDILRTSGDDRDIAVAFMHGYLLGKSGKDTFNRATLSAATDNFIEACLNDVNGVAVKTLKKQLK
ncbi:MAG: HdeA family protein [Gammaproteobacteria bacterium]|nr:HdeA family protein [Gammaproteobacteria bacterium]